MNLEDEQEFELQLDVGLCLDDIISKINQQSNYSFREQSSQQTRIINRVRVRSRSPYVNKLVVQKQQKEIEEQTKTQQSEFERKKRQQELKMKLQSQKEEKRMKELQERDIQRQQQAEAERNQQLQKEKFFKEQTKKKQQIQEFKVKVDEERKLLLFKEMEEKERLQQQIKDQQQQFFSKQKDKIVSDLESLKITREKHAEQEKKKQLIEQQKLIKQKQKAEEQLVFEKEKRELEQQNRDKFIKLCQSQVILSFFSAYDRALEQIFIHFSSNQSTMQFKDFMHFIVLFNIVPALISLEDAQLLYRSATRDKKMIEKVPVGVTAKEFQEALVRITAKSLAKLIKFKDLQEQSSMHDLEKSMQLIQSNSDSISKIIVDHYALDQYDVNTLNQEEILIGLQVLARYMNLDQDKATLAARLRTMKVGLQKARPPRDKKQSLLS